MQRERVKCRELFWDDHTFLFKTPYWLKTEEQKIQYIETAGYWQKCAGYPSRCLTCGGRNTRKTMREQTMSTQTD